MDFLNWPEFKTPGSAAFISDLHLFSRRSNFARHQVAISGAIEQSEMCVWGGDLFDFRWAQLGCDATTVSRSIEWLDDWLVRFPDKPFVFLRGNHDAHAAFATALEQLSRCRENLYCGIDAVRVADTLMLHGDLIEGEGTRASLAKYRESWEARPTAHPFQHRAYDAIVAARLHTAVASAAHRHRRTCQRLWKSIDAELSQEIVGLRRVVFGHTHRHIHAMKLAGIEFYNAGATIRHVKFAPVVLRFGKDKK